MQYDYIVLYQLAPPLPRSTPLPAWVVSRPQLLVRTLPPPEGDIPLPDEGEGEGEEDTKGTYPLTLEQPDQAFELALYGHQV
jgi:hypothetical protein